MKLILCGCGALGSRIGLDLCRLFDSIMLIDDDQVREHNIPNSVYIYQDIGALKRLALGEHIWEKSYRNIDAVALGRNNPKKGRLESLILDNREIVHFIGEDEVLIVDTFDNSRSRELTNISHQVPLLHVVHIGVGSTDYGEVVWGNVDYRYHDPEVLENEVCTRDLGLPVILLTAAAGSHSILYFLETGKKINKSITDGKIFDF